MRPDLDNNELKQITKVLDSKFLTEGPATQKFESTISKYVGSKYAIATTSATTALHAIFESLDIKGKKVLVSDYTFPATALAIIQSGGIPILSDVDRETMNMTKNIVESNKTKSVNFICPVSIFGNPLEKEFYSLKKNHMIIEDAATSLGAKQDKKFVGSLANVSCFSFHPRKIITTGEGGMITTDEKILYEKISSFKSFGKQNNNFENMGTNYKLSDIQSAIGLAQMKKINKIIKIRKKFAMLYDELLEKIDYVIPQKPSKNSRHTYQSYVCIIEKPKLRDKIRNQLQRQNIETQIGTYALHRLPFFQKCKKLDKLSNSDFLYDNCISIPLHHELTYHDQEIICKIIKNTIKHI